MYTLESVTLAPLQVGASTPTQTQAQTYVSAWLNTVPALALRAVMIEGAGWSVQAPPDVALRTVSAGCVCCAGQTVLKVQLTQMLRLTRPQHLLLALVQTGHWSRFRAQLEGGLLGFRAIELHHMQHTGP